MNLLSHCHRSPPGSLTLNMIGPEGASALAAVLKDTQITNLKCAATHPTEFAFVSAPADTHLPSYCAPHSSLAVSGATTSELRAPPRSPPSSRRRRSPPSGAPPPPTYCSKSCQRPPTRSCPLTVPPPILRAVLWATRSETRAPLRLPPSSRRRWSPASSAPPPHSDSVRFRVTTR